MTFKQSFVAMCVEEFMVLCLYRFFTCKLTKHLLFVIIQILQYMNETVLHQQSGASQLTFIPLSLF
jgi:hypothetical protein